MGKSQDGRQRFTVEIAGQKVSMRVANQHEAYRINLLVDYLNAVMKFSPKATYEDVSKLLLADFEKTLKFITSIQNKLASGKVDTEPDEREKEQDLHDNA